MTIPQIVAVLEADDRRAIISGLRMSSAVWAGVAPTVSKEGYNGARRWAGAMEKALKEA
jgi:hypothetical protein